MNKGFIRNRLAGPPPKTAAQPDVDSVGQDTFAEAASAPKQSNKLGTPFGGRTGDALQSNYTSDTFRVVPMATAGFKYTHQVSDNLALQAGGEANIPLGPGFGTVSLRAGLEGELGPLQMEAGGKFDGSWNGANELDFIDTNGVRPGAYRELSLNHGSLGEVFT